MRITILCRERPGQTNAIRDASLALLQALEDAGVDAAYLGRTIDGPWVDVTGRTRPLDGRTQRGDVVVLQYQPFLWGRWGVAPWLPAATARLARRGVRVVLLVHEPFVEAESWKRVLLGAWQRTQLEALRLPAELVCVTIEPWTRRLSTWWPARRTMHLPVGSNVPDRRASRAASRQALGVDDKTLVVVTLDTGHPSQRVVDAAAAVSRLAQSGEPVVWLALGAGASAPTTSQVVRVHRPGLVPASELASLVAAGDLFLAPFGDGVSTRRSSVMAALQHGLPVLGTDGPLTDPSLRHEPGLVLVPAGAPERLIEEAKRLVERRDELPVLGASARALYARRFAWPVIAARLLDALG